MKRQLRSGRDATLGWWRGEDPLPTLRSPSPRAWGGLAVRRPRASLFEPRDSHERFKRGGGRKPSHLHPFTGTRVLPTRARELGTPTCVIVFPWSPETATSRPGKCWALKNRCPSSTAEGAFGPAASPGSRLAVPALSQTCKGKRGVRPAREPQCNVLCVVLSTETVVRSVMILPQVHLRKPCYDFYFL